MNSSKFVFFVLTKNEENTILVLLEKLRKNIAEIGIIHFEILLIDDSTDSTSDKAKEAGATVVLGYRAGLGAAYRLGLLEAIKKNADYIISLDGDGQVDIDELHLFVDPLFKGYDLVLGSRFKNINSIEYSYPKINHLGAKTLASFLSYMTRQRLTDSHGGFRAMRSAVAKKTIIEGNHTYVQESIIEASEAGFKIIEISSKWMVRANGGSRVVSSVPRYIRKVGPYLFMRFIFKLFFGRSRL